MAHLRLPKGKQSWVTKADRFIFQIGNNRGGVKRGLFRFKAVWIATTPPTKKDIKDTIPIDPMIKELISFMIRPFITLHLVNLPKTLPTIMEYEPIL